MSKKYWYIYQFSFLNSQVTDDNSGLQYYFNKLNKVTNIQSSKAIDNTQFVCCSCRIWRRVRKGRVQMTKLRVVFVAALVALSGLYELGLCMRMRHDNNNNNNNNVIRMKVGGGAEIDALARFAVQEHNNKEVFPLSLFLSFISLIY